MKREKLDALRKLLRSRGAASRPLAEAGLSDADCRGLAGALPAPDPPPAAQAPAGTCRLYCDGASRGNPGPAAAGFFIEKDGEELYSDGRTLGTLTNNQAEYKSLLAGLEAAGRLKISKLEIFMDSQLVVRQIEGRYKVRNEGLKPLHAEALLALGRLGAWRISHVPRKENSRADALANAALDSL